MTSKPVILFDVDGTLAETERDGHRVAFNRAFAEAGLAWQWSAELYGELLKITGGKERIRHYIDTKLEEFQVDGDLPEFIKHLHQRKTHFYTTLLNEGAVPLRTGVLRLLGEARESGCRMAIVTTTTPANVHALLVNTLGDDGESWFELIAAGDIVPAKKPAPDIYTYTLEKMNVAASECVAVEDSRNGLLSAQAAGIKTLITLSDYSQSESFTGANLVVNHLGEPDQPMTVVQGDAHGHTYVSVQTLAQL